MKRIQRLCSVVAMCLLAVGVAHAETDAKGSKDHPLLPRMPGFFIYEYEDKDFDKHDFATTKDDSRTAIEGHSYYLVYTLEPGTKQPGELKVIRNIQNALVKIGGKIRHEGELPYRTTISLTRDGKETWFEVRAFPTVYRMWIVEREAMTQEISANAAAMGGDIKSTGHAAIYGIFFDTGNAEVKPESEQALSEIAKLLKEDSGLKLHVVGHTDNVGNFAANQKLSQARATAVQKVLVSKYGVDAARLNAVGVGAAAPVASNRSEEGRAKNRRVELVEQ